MTELRIRLVDTEGYHVLIDQLAEEMPDRRFLFGQVGGRNARITLDEGSNSKRVADFIYPAEIFSDPGTMADVKEADKSLLTTAFIPQEYLDQTTDCVYTAEEMHELVDRVAEAVDGDAAFLIGGFSPGRNYQITGNPENSKPRKISALQYPEYAFDTEAGCEPLHNLHLGLPGTLVIEQLAFTEEALAFMRDERDRLPIQERDTGPYPEDLNAELRDLSPGDRVTVNDRSRPLTVIPSEDTRQLSWSSGETVFLRGNGTDYRIHVRDGKYPRMDWSSDRTYVKEVDVEERSAEAEAVEA